MEDYKRGSHTVWDCKYHLVWMTKYRYQVLEGEVGQRCRELLREIAQSLELVIYAGSINRDHVHMLIGIPPNVSVSRCSILLVQFDRIHEIPSRVRPAPCVHHLRSADTMHINRLRDACNAAGRRSA
jgi:REP element-mobilizing transposase RayT